MNGRCNATKMEPLRMENATQINDDLVSHSGINLHQKCKQKAMLGKLKKNEIIISQTVKINIIREKLKREECKFIK